MLEVRTEMDGEPIAIIPTPACAWWRCAGTETDFGEAQELYLVYKGEGSLSLSLLNLKADKGGQS